MLIPDHRWNKLFLFCLGLLLAASFAMKWIESDLLWNGEKVSILGLELFYGKDKMVTIFTGLDEPIRRLIRYHLTFDFVFMAGCYPAIASLCMMATRRAPASFGKVLLLIAYMQLLAWGCDIAENCSLFYWINIHNIGSNFGLFHVVVAVKWIIALAGLVTALLFVFRPRR